MEETEVICDHAAVCHAAVCSHARRHILGSLVYESNGGQCSRDKCQSEKVEVECISTKSELGKVVCLIRAIER